MNETAPVNAHARFSATWSGLFVVRLMSANAATQQKIIIPRNLSVFFICLCYLVRVIVIVLFSAGALTVNNLFTALP